LHRYWEELCEIRQQKGLSDPRGKMAVAVSLCIAKKTKERPPLEPWQAPQHDWMKVNVDGAFDAASGEGGAGVVIRDSRGRVQLTAWKFISQCVSAEEAEALACKEGLELAAKWCRQGIILETDCGTIASMLMVRL
jgi:hypothetical protein